MLRFVAPVVVALLALSHGRITAADPTHDLLTLVPPESSVCFVVKELRGTAARLLDSPFAELFPKSAFGRALLAHDDLKSLRQANDVLTAQLGVTAADLRDDILGDAAVMAYQSGPNGDEAGVILVKARKPELLAALVRRFNEAQVKGGELAEVREKTHAGRPYFERVKAGGGREFHLTTADGTFAYSAQEEMLRLVIDRMAQTPPRAPLAEQYAALGVSKAAGVVLFNPRTMDAELATHAKAGDANEQAFLSHFCKVWAATDAVGLAVHLDRHADLSVVAAFDPKKLPAELRPLLTGSADGSALWSVIPDDALFAAAGRFDLTRLIGMVEPFLSDTTRDGARKATAEAIRPLVGKDTLPKVSAGVGPDWGLWVAAPAAGDAGPLPTVTFALRVRPAGSADRTVGDAILAGLDFAAQLFRFEYNKTHDDEFTLTVEKHAAGEVKVLRNDKALPPGVRPAYGVRGDFLVIGSHPRVVTGFTPPTAAAASDPPLLRVSAKRWADYLKSHHKPLGGLFAGGVGEKPDALGQQFADFAVVLELFDRFEVRHTGDGRTARLILRVVTAKPLQK